MEIFAQRHRDALDKAVAPFINDNDDMRVLAFCVALLRYMDRNRRPSLFRWIQMLLYEYRHRQADPEEGPKRAKAWLLSELGKGPPGAV